MGDETTERPAQVGAPRRRWVPIVVVVVGIAMELAIVLVWSHSREPWASHGNEDREVTQVTHHSWTEVRVFWTSGCYDRWVSYERQWWGWQKNWEGGTWDRCMGA